LGDKKNDFILANNKTGTTNKALNIKPILKS